MGLNVSPLDLVLPRPFVPHWNFEMASSRPCEGLFRRQFLKDPVLPYSQVIWKLKSTTKWLFFESV